MFTLFFHFKNGLHKLYFFTSEVFKNYFFFDSLQWTNLFQVSQNSFTKKFPKKLFTLCNRAKKMHSLIELS